MDAAAELCALKCSAAVDAARDTVSASFAAAVVAGDFCATYSRFLPMMFFKLLLRREKSRVYIESGSCRRRVH